MHPIGRGFNPLRFHLFRFTAEKEQTGKLALVTVERMPPQLEGRALGWYPRGLGSIPSRGTGERQV